MPLFGELTLDAVLPRLPTLKDLDAEAWELPGAEILQLAWEVDDGTRALLPRAMHPAVPPYITCVVTRFPASPVGEFSLALVRLMGRAGAHPRGVVLGAVATSADAAAALREGWGFPAEVGEVRLARYHDVVGATVVRAGVVVLDVALANPETISGGDVQYMPSVTLARVREGGETRPQLVQIDPHYTFHRAERGRPRLRHLDAAAWNAAGMAVADPIAASAATCDTDLPRIRFVMDPEIPVVRGTRRIR